MDLTKFNVIFFVIMLCISMASWVYWLADIFESRHPLPIQDRRPKTWHELVVILTLLAVGFMVTMSALQLGGHLNAPEVTSEIKQRLLSNLQMQFFLFLIIGIPFFVVSEKQRDDFGFRKFGIGSQITDGCVGFIVALAPISLALFMTKQYRSLDTVHPLLKLVGPELGWGNFALLSVTAVVTAPLWEELLYRVLLQGFLQDRIHPFRAILYTSLAFGFVHGWPDMIPIFTLSLVLGYFFYRTNSYLTVVVLHALFNLYNLLNVLM